MPGRFVIFVDVAVFYVGSGVWYQKMFPCIFRLKWVHFYRLFRSYVAPFGALSGIALGVYRPVSK